MTAWLEAHAIAASLAALFAGFAFVTLAKLYGFVFMRGRTVHRLGTNMQGQPGNVVEWSGGGADGRPDRKSGGLRMSSQLKGHHGSGLVSIGGELWQARSHQSFAPGDTVIVRSVNGLTLEVDKM